MHSGPLQTSPSIHSDLYDQPPQQYLGWSLSKQLQHIAVPKGKEKGKMVGGGWEEEEEEEDEEKMKVLHVCP